MAFTFTPYCIYIYTLSIYIYTFSIYIYTLSHLHLHPFHLHLHPFHLLLHPLCARVLGVQGRKGVLEGDELGVPVPHQQLVPLTGDLLLPQQLSEVCELPATAVQSCGEQARHGCAVRLHLHLGCVKKV